MERFNHIESDKNGNASIIYMTASGLVRRIPLTRRDLATMVTDIGVVLTSDENRKIQTARSTHD